MFCKNWCGAPSWTMCVYYSKLSYMIGSVWKKQPLQHEKQSSTTVLARVNCKIRNSILNNLTETWNSKNCQDFNWKSGLRNALFLCKKSLRIFLNESTWCTKSKTFKRNGPKPKTFWMNWHPKMHSLFLVPSSMINWQKMMPILNIPKHS